jgi:hypothetical protein
VQFLRMIRSSYPVRPSIGNLNVHELVHLRIGQLNRTLS